MKKSLFTVLTIVALIFSSCDKVENPFPPKVNTDLDTTIYAGNWSDYLANQWPDFSSIPNENPDRNVLIEDFTGHNCNFCPAAGEIAHAIHTSNPSRVFIASIHASNTISGTSSFQDVNTALGYTIDFKNANGLELGKYFGYTLPLSGFFGNPAGTVSRTNDGGEYFPASGSWSSKTNAVLRRLPTSSSFQRLDFFFNP